VTVMLMFVVVSVICLLIPSSLQSLSEDRSADSAFFGSDLDLDEDANILRQRLAQAIRLRLALLAAGYHPKVVPYRPLSSIDSNNN
ncbi:hypothetical protein V3C99_008642, partial [Haemonchus contortus]